MTANGVSEVTSGDFRKFEVPDFFYEFVDVLSDPKYHLNSESPGKDRWDLYMMMLAKTVSLKTSCLRRQIGAVIAQNNRIISTGFNGPVSGEPECAVVGCVRNRENITSGTSLDNCNAIHAEENALLWAGHNAVGGTMYTTTTPCSRCTKLIRQAGIIRVVCLEKYPGYEQIAKQLASSGIEMVIFNSKE